MTIKKERKLDTIKLSSEYRSEILTTILKFYKDFAEKEKTFSTKLLGKFQAYKHHWSGISLPIVLEITPCSLDQLDPATNVVLASYNFKDIDGIIGIKDYPGGIVLAYGGFSRLHLFKSNNHHEIIQNMVQLSTQFVGVDIKVLPNQITLDQFERQRFGIYSGDEYVTSMSEFIVQKVTARHSEPTKRILCLTDATILERDPQTYSVSVFKIF